MSPTDPERVRDRLHDVVDPCSAATGSNLDFVEMGLVKEVRVESGRAHVEMRLTSPMCHMVPYFIQEVKNRVGELADIDSVELETDDGFEWDAEIMSEDAKRRRKAVLAEHEARYRRERA